MNAPQSIVIVGAGQAGAVAARTLRESGYSGTLTLVGDEIHLPYERPPLSKEALGSDVHDSLGRLHPQDFYAGLDITHAAGTHAHHLDPAHQTVSLSDGSTLRYDACLLATGGRARRLALLPDSLTQVHTLRTLDDAIRLGTALSPRVRLAVIGGGFLGLETAWTASQRGAQVTVLEGSHALLARALPPDLSAWLLARAQALGIEVLLGAAVSSALPPATATGGMVLGLEDGRQIEADQILVAVGLIPETSLAREAGLALCETTYGILVDAENRTSDPHIWAAGDCASQCRKPGGSPVRYESWQNANTHAAMAAAAMIGAPAPTTPYPWFWTDQMGCNIQILGAPEPGLHYVMRGTLDVHADTPKFICLGLKDGVPVYGAAVNAGGDLRALRVLFERARPIQADAFCDPANPLKPLIKSSL